MSQELHPGYGMKIGVGRGGFQTRPYTAPRQMSIVARIALAQSGEQSPLGIARGCAIEVTGRAAPLRPSS